VSIGSAVYQSVDAAANGASAKSCITCAACSIGVLVVEHESILLTSLKSVPGP
jgi:hypothetical protein